MRFVVFIAILALILGGSAWYLGYRVIQEAGWAQTHTGVIWYSLALFVSLQLLGPILYRAFPWGIGKLFIFHWITYTALGVFASAFLYTWTADVLFGAWMILFGCSENLSRLHLFTITALTALTAAVGLIQALMGPRLYRVDVPLKDLPAEFDGFSILQISDLHVGPTIGARYVRKVVAIAKSTAPDVVTLTGDFMDGSVEHLKDALAPLKEIPSKHGTFFVTGNHEYYWGADGWIQEFRGWGARVLLNENVAIAKKGKHLVIAGVPDISAARMHRTHTSDPQQALAGAPENATKILLAHSPNSYKQAAAAGFHVQLSGHTHGGQFFPWSIFVWLAHKYYKGLYRHENLWVYVSRGTGYWGPPLRFTVPAEITLLCLKRADV